MERREWARIARGGRGRVRIGGYVFHFGKRPASGQQTGAKVITGGKEAGDKSDRTDDKT
jgi:uncharacterized membrane protein YedE/YeeE